MTHNSSVPLFWRTQSARYNIIGTKCTNCKTVFFPPRVVCPKCRSKGKLEDFQFAGGGEILSYTVIRVPPEGFEKSAPYAVAIIRLDEGTNVAGQIVGDIEKIDIGKRVRPVFRKMVEDGEEGLIHYGIKWETTT
jgi:uncharacterized OB-fold protein